MDSLTSLPTDCLLRIFASLSVQDWACLSCTCTRLHELEQDDMLWKILAQQKWGSLIDEIDPPANHWRDYCKHRLSTYSMPKSPLNLIQESYPDPWQHIVCCMLCSRTTGGETIRKTIAEFFNLWQTPSDVVAAETDAICAAIHSLGLQAQRCAGLKAMSEAFLKTEWVEPSEFKGCGVFVTDSWRIFCRGHRQLNGVSDANLQRYLRWFLNKDSTQEHPDGEEEEQKERKTSSKKRRKAKVMNKKMAAAEEQSKSHQQKAAREKRRVNRDSKPKADGRVTRSGFRLAVQ